jgi:VWFA-related protein
MALHPLRPLYGMSAFRLLFLSLCACSISAQQPTSPVDPGALPEMQAPVSTLHLNVRRVVVDVVVTDPQGKPVKNLKKDDFRILEDGKTEALRSFDLHVAESQPTLPKPDLPPNTFSNLSTAPQSGPVTVILYDLLNTPLESQAYAHEELLQFLKQRKVSGQMAIFVLSDKLHMLQGFTDDESQLISALNTKHNQSYRSGLLQSPGESSQASDQFARTEGNQDAATASESGPSQPNIGFAQVSAMLKHMESMETSRLTDERVRITAEALQQIARFLIGLPGRKNLLWMSASFPSGVLPNGEEGGRDTFNVTRNYSEIIMRSTDLLNLSHVAIYPVDVRGLQVNPMFSAASTQSFAPNSGADLAAVKTFNDTTAAEHSTMDTLADETGGRAFYNTNGLKEAVTTALQEGSAYYTLTYSPAQKQGLASEFDGNLRHVRVQLTNPALAGYKLYYRRSYFNDDLDNQVDAAEDLPTDPLAVTLQHGAPVAHELFFEAHLQTYEAPTPATEEQMKVLAEFKTQAKRAMAAVTSGGKKGKNVVPVVVDDKHPPLMQRYVILYGLLLRQLTLAEGSDGKHRGNLEFAVISYDEDGMALNGINSKVADVIQPERYQHLQTSGYQVVQTIAVPVNAVSLRLAVLDASSNRMGSMEVRLPLPPAPALPQPPAAVTPAKIP